MNQLEKTEYSQEEVMSLIQQNVRESQVELEALLPQLGHSQTKRLLVAVMNYPLDDADFSGESTELIQAFSACKRISDALVALGVEVVIQQMAKNQGIEENSDV